MNGTTKCSGAIIYSGTAAPSLIHEYASYCQLRNSCRVHQRYVEGAPAAAYELVPPFIGRQCDHYERKQE